MNQEDLNDLIDKNPSPEALINWQARHGHVEDLPTGVLLRELARREALGKRDD